MRIYFLFLSLFLYGTVLMAQAKARSRNVVIYGHVTETGEYCGGAMPSEEKLEYLRTPHAMSQKTIYIKYGSVNKESVPVIKKLVTDENGNFKVTLKCGKTYMFLEDWKGEPFIEPKNTEFVTWDMSCIKKRYATADFVVRTKATRNQKVIINYFVRCQFRPYCGNYTGPLPP